MKTSFHLSVAVFVVAVINVSAATLYVSLESTNPVVPYRTWGTAATNIQDAVDAAQHGDTVLITNGVYAVGSRDCSVLDTNCQPPQWADMGPSRVEVTNAVTLLSVNGPSATLIDGGQTMRCVFLGDGGVLSGFTLARGNTFCVGGGAWGGTLYNCTLTWNRAYAGGGACGSAIKDCTLKGNAAFYGGGAYLSELDHCTVIDNWAFRGGGGGWGGKLQSCWLERNLALWGGGVNGGVVDDCTLSGNHAEVGGGACGGTLSDCTITGNEADSTGGGSHGSVLSNCSLTNNLAEAGGGVSGGTLHNCTLSGNSADCGGGAYGDDDSPCTLSNCALFGNSAGDGGGAYGATLNSCTLVANSAYYGGGSFGGSINNSILWFNTATNGPNYTADAEHPLLISYCCSTPMPEGTGNISLDPLLAGPWHLSAASPCRAAGNRASVCGLDIDGEAWADPPSMGCDEYRPGAVGGPLEVKWAASHRMVPPGYVVSLTATVQGRTCVSVWDFGDGVQVSNRLFVTHAWTRPGEYAVALRAYNEDHAEGVGSTGLVAVAIQPVVYVAAGNSNPVPPYSSWATAATNIQAAVDLAAAGASVVVSNGVYATGGRGQCRVSADRPVALRSVNGPGVTIIDGGGAVRCAYLANGASLAGFTLTNGYAGEGAGVICQSEKAFVLNCRITGNRAYWNAAGAYYGTLSNCIITANSAGWVGGGAFFGTLGNCILRSNHATNQGGGAYGSTLWNCTVTSNSASSGGGAYRATLNSCTVTANSAAACGGGAAWSTLSNCIVYSNTATLDPNYNLGEYPAVLNYCCTTPMPINGTGNIAVDPGFENGVTGDYRLRPDSPCVDAGANLSSLWSTDILGLPRPMDGDGDGIACFDIGAYEFNPYRFESAVHLGVEGFQFTVRGERGRNVRLERSRDLLHWEYAGEVPIPGGGQTLIDPAAASESNLFYRVMRVP